VIACGGLPVPGSANTIRLADLREEKRPNVRR